MPHNPTIDVTKGILILLVIAGHMSFVPLDQSLWRWVIYSFHMPVFMGVCGYLINLEKVRTEPFAEIVRRYAIRLVLPWTVAVLFYHFVFFPDQTLAGAFWNPPYHLWFVRALLIFVGIAWFVPASPRVMLALAFCIGVVGMALFDPGHIGITPMVGKLLGDKRVLTMAPWFFLGLYIRTEPRAVSVSALAIAAALGLAVAIYEFFARDMALLIVSLLGLNIALVLMLPPLFAQRIKAPILEHIGRNSLIYYLCHPAVLFVIGVANPR